MISQQSSLSVEHKQAALTSAGSVEWKAFDALLGTHPAATYNLQHLTTSGKWGKVAVELKPFVASCKGEKVLQVGL